MLLINDRRAGSIIYLNEDYGFNYKYIYICTHIHVLKGKGMIWLHNPRSNNGSVAVLCIS